MGSENELTSIVGFPNYRVASVDFEDDSLSSRAWVRLQRSGRRAPVCSGCGRATAKRRDWKIRSWEDLPWAGHPVTLMCAVWRLRCPRCGIRSERVPFAEPKARVTRRLQTRIGLDCQSMPTSHAAVRHGVSWGKARRAEKFFLLHWERSRPRRRPRHLSADEIQRGRGQRYWTVLSDLVHTEVIGLARDRTQVALEGLLDSALDARQRAGVEAMCTDMHQPYLNAIAAKLSHTEVVFGRVEGRRGGVQGEPICFRPFRLTVPHSLLHHSVSGPRHFEPDRRFSRIRLTAKASSNRAYDSVPAGADFRALA